MYYFIQHAHITYQTLNLYYPIQDHSIQFVLVQRTKYYPNGRLTLIG
jgi:hypothetical protein